MSENLGVNVSARASGAQQATSLTLLYLGGMCAVVEVESRPACASPCAWALACRVLAACDSAEVGLRRAPALEARAAAGRMGETTTPVPAKAPVGACTGDLAWLPGPAPATQAPAAFRLPCPPDDGEPFRPAWKRTARLCAEDVWSMFPCIGPACRTPCRCGAGTA